MGVNRGSIGWPVPAFGLRYVNTAKFVLQYQGVCVSMLVAEVYPSKWGFEGSGR